MSLEELIPESHLVRVVNSAIERMNIDPLVQRYKGGGTSSYHPKMMPKVLVYAYTQKVYSSRQIAKRCVRISRDSDLDGLRAEGPMDSKKLEEKTREFDERLARKGKDRELTKAAKTLKGDYLPRLQKYEDQEVKLKGRNSY